MIMYYKLYTYSYIVANGLHIDREEESDHDQ